MERIGNRTAVGLLAILGFAACTGTLSISATVSGTGQEITREIPTVEYVLRARVDAKAFEISEEAYGRLRLSACVTDKPEDECEERTTEDDPDSGAWVVPNASITVLRPRAQPGQDEQPAVRNLHLGEGEETLYIDIFSNGVDSRDEEIIVRIDKADPVLGEDGRPRDVFITWTATASMVFPDQRYSPDGRVSADEDANLTFHVVEVRSYPSNAGD